METRPSTDSPQQPAFFLLMALWFGVSVGWGEVLLKGVKKLFLHKFIHLSSDFVWMVPLADTSIFLAVGLIFCFLALCRPGSVSLRVSVFLLALLGSIGLLLWQRRIHPLAGTLLAIGIAIQTSYFATAYSESFQRVVRRTTPWMISLVFLSALTLFGWKAISEQRAMAKLPPAPLNAPNVLFIVLDTVRAQSLSLYGYPRPTTPHLERLAKTGVAFDRAFSTTSWTLPSHASMFTGRFPHELSADWKRPLDPDRPTLAQVLAGRGYATAGFVANTVYCLAETGIGRGFIHYEDYPLSLGAIMRSSWLAHTIADPIVDMMQRGQPLVSKNAEEINRSFLAWLSRRGRNPFFVFLNYMDAHEPYLPPQPFDAMFTSKKPADPRIRVGYQYTPEETREMKDAYESAIAYLDHQLGLLFDELEKRGLLANTLVIITSDHGEEFGEHGLMNHGNSLYLPSLHVPLLISHPQHIPAGKRISQPVTLRDIAATVLDLLKMEPRLPGISLARHWEGSRDSSRGVSSPILSEVSFAPNNPKWYPISKGDMKSLILNGYHYIKNGDGREELYRYKTDLWEKRDLVRSGKNRQRLDWFRKPLEAFFTRVHYPAKNRHERLK